MMKNKVEMLLRIVRNFDTESREGSFKLKLHYLGLLGEDRTTCHAGDTQV